MARTRLDPAAARIAPGTNQILAAMPRDFLSRFQNPLEPVFLPRGAVLYESGVPQRHVYFPADAVVSLVYILENGSPTRTALVGSDGLVGLAPIMGGGGTPTCGVVLISGAAFRLPAVQLTEELRSEPESLRFLLHYVQALITQMAQTAVCYRHHSIRQQLCVLLLSILDRRFSRRIPMTQEMIAHTLGVRREGVTEAACGLQKAEVIRYCRGQIEVLDRGQLEAGACECYGVVKTECDRLLSLSRPAERLVSPVTRLYRRRPKPHA